MSDKSVQKVWFPEAKSECGMKFLPATWKGKAKSKDVGIVFKIDFDSHISIVGKKWRVIRQYNFIVEFVRQQNGDFFEIFTGFYVYVYLTICIKVTA